MLIFLWSAHLFRGPNHSVIPSFQHDIEVLQPWLIRKENIEVLTETHFLRGTYLDD